MCAECIYESAGYLYSVCTVMSAYVCWGCIFNVCVCLVYLGNADNGYVFTHAFVLKMGVTETYSRTLLRTPESVCMVIVGDSLGWDRGAGSAMNSSRQEETERHTSRT